MLIDYSKVFSTNEYDIGNFTAIEHCIDTGDSQPIKQRLRRKPFCFAGGEEKHLEQMIKADVTEPPISEWASSSVLICKRDRSVRWYEYYRALNKVIQKRCISVTTGGGVYRFIVGQYLILQTLCK